MLTILTTDTDSDADAVVRIKTRPRIESLVSSC